MTNKQKLIDLIIKMFKSDEFEFVESNAIGNNEIHFTHFPNYEVVTYSEYEQSSMGERVESFKNGRFRNEKKLQMPLLNCKIIFNDGKSKLKLHWDNLTPKWNPEDYDIEDVKHSFWQKINIFGTYPDKIYRIKDMTSKYYIKCGKVKEFLSIVEYTDLCATLIQLREDAMARKNEKIRLEDQLLIEETLNKLQ